MKYCNKPDDNKGIQIGAYYGVATQYGGLIKCNTLASAKVQATKIGQSQIYLRGKFLDYGTYGHCLAAEKIKGCWRTLEQE